MSDAKQQRIERAVLANLGTSLERIQTDLEEMALPLIDVRPFESAVRQHWQRAGEQSGASEATASGLQPRELITLGQDPDTSPAPLGRYLAAVGLQEIVTGWLEALEKIRQAEEQKLGTWAERRTGLDAEAFSFDRERLAFVKDPPLSRATRRALRLSRQVLDADEETLQRAASTPEGPDERAFIRDLAQARSDGERMDQLLHDMWDAASPDVIDEVLAQADLKGGTHEGVVAFYGEKLKELLGLPDDDRKLVLDWVNGE